MNELLTWFSDAVTPAQLIAGARAAVVLVVGWMIAGFVGKRIRLPKLTPQQNMLLQRVVRWGLLLVAVAAALNELGFSLAPLLGAAGVLTVALGFASQTSVSNLISGLFLIGEQPFKVGDVIKVDGITGIVMSIDVMAVRVRTFDNLLVRIPNEKVLKANLTNFTAFEIRRHDLNVGVPHAADLERVREVLLRVAREHPLVLAEPEPLVIVKGFESSSTELLFCCWAQIPDFLAVKNEMHERVKRAFDEADLAIAVPRVEVSGSLAA
jgi:small-conductance mechanosensitive channel